MITKQYHVFFFLTVTYFPGFIGSMDKTTKCESYNSSQCTKPTVSDCFETKYCLQPDHEKRNHCFVLWKVNDTTNEITIKMKGCFLDNIDCYDREKCWERRAEPKNDLYFCCCQGDMCNEEFSWVPQATSTTLRPLRKSPKFVVDNQALTTISLYTIVPVSLIAIVIALNYWIYRQKKLSYFNEIPSLEDEQASLNLQGANSPLLGPRPIQLQEIKARGRFGAVWKAQYKADLVAVKIFPMQDKQSWLAEQEIFKLPHMDHCNILRFIGVERRGDDLQAEFWLITAYHEHGSLCDYLKANTLTWAECCGIVETMARGLMHLHEEMVAVKGDGYKPAIAHRDFKSKNVLLKSDLSACIADFGLALVFQSGKTCGATHGQVGTRRYMAPEVLEGAINFSRDAFLRIDMYACGLVIWEIASRCLAGRDSLPMAEYQPPFQADVSAHPTLEDIQECVVEKKKRPEILDSWRKHAGLAMLSETMEECWDHDAEARLSASCVVERVSHHSRLLNDGPSAIVEIKDKKDLQLQ